jgi:hypothetical protein
MNWRAILFSTLLLSACGLQAADSVFLVDSNLVCVRPGDVSENFIGSISSVRLAGKPAGTILDLRFAGGDAGAIDPALKFFSVKKTPLVILVNGQTRDGAEELAARLRAVRAGILIGSTNSPEKIFPDIAVNVGTNDEKKFLENPYEITYTNGSSAAVTYAFTNADGRITKTTVPKELTQDLLPLVDHTTEADLVRKKVKDGEDAGEADLTPRPAPAQPVLRDPALARAADLLKALAALDKSKG